MTRYKQAPIAVALLFALAACQGRVAEGGRADAAVAAPSTSISSAASSSAEPSPPPSSSADAALARPVAEDASATLDESVMERLVFRQVLVGGYTFNWRRTWLFYRSDKRARLDVLCQNGVDYKRLTGGENDESAWKKPVLMRYTGKREGKDGYRMTLATGTPGKYECEWMPETIVLSCRSEPIAVLRAGATFIVDNASEGLFHWTKGPPEQVPGLRCSGATNQRFDWPLVFVAPKGGAVGVEWAFQHDDAIQQGAYRWMP